MSSLFLRHIFPLWRCSQTAPTNGSVNLHCARQSPECMRSATSWEKRGDGYFAVFYSYAFAYMLWMCHLTELFFEVVPNSWQDISNLLKNPYESPLSTLSGFWHCKLLVTFFWNTHTDQLICTVILGLQKNMAFEYLTIGNSRPKLDVPYPDSLKATRKEGQSLPRGNSYTGLIHGFKN